MKPICKLPAPTPLRRRADFQSMVNIEHRWTQQDLRLRDHLISESMRSMFRRYILGIHIGLVERQGAELSLVTRNLQCVYVSLGEISNKSPSVGERRCCFLKKREIVIVDWTRGNGRPVENTIVKCTVVEKEGYDTHPGLSKFPFSSHARLLKTAMEMQTYLLRIHTVLVRVNQ